MCVQSKDAVVKAAAARCIDLPLSQRQLCAARLITLADQLDKQQQQAAHQQQHTKGGKQAAEQQQAAQQQPQQEYVAGVATFVSKLQQSGAAELATAAEGEEAAAEAAHAAAASLEGTLARLQARLAGGAAGGPTAQQRLRALAHLLRLLLLHWPRWQQTLTPSIRLPSKDRRSRRRQRCQRQRSAAAATTATRRWQRAEMRRRRRRRTGTTP